jgi:hypothetical protein
MSDSSAPVHDCVPRPVSRAAKKDRILALLGHYRPQLGLNDWKLNIQWFNKRDGQPDPSAASCCASPEYREADLSFTLDELPMLELPGIVLHELLHAVLWEMTSAMDRWAKGDVEREETARRALERVTVHLERVLLHALPPPPELSKMDNYGV